jgi:hypothetical protein
MSTILLFDQPIASGHVGRHHSAAAAGNTDVVDEALQALSDAISGASPTERILLKAAAGAGKSRALRRMVAEVSGMTTRVAIVAFTNKQTRALAEPLAKDLGKDDVCLFVAKDRAWEVPQKLVDDATVTTSTDGIPQECSVVISTCHKLGGFGEQARQRRHFGLGHSEPVYDVLFVDEAWQIPHHLFDKVARLAPIIVGVGDVGQLPPLEAGANPWRGDSGYNPYRAWPTDYDDGEDEDTRVWELPAVWRPSAGQLPLWRAFYPEWEKLECVAAPGDRVIEATGLNGVAAEVWAQVGTGVPTLLTVDGLNEPEAPDVDLPLIEFVEALIDQLFSAGLVLSARDYDESGDPTGSVTKHNPGSGGDNPLVAVLATRNQAVDDAADAVDRVRTTHGLSDDELISSTVDSYQGQTNGITIAVHPLSGASELDSFNSAFGRLAVTCTRATHGLLMVTRPGLEQLLAEAPARPGTPFGEPGNRQLPRQTHQRILATFARARVNAADVLEKG